MYLSEHFNYGPLKTGEIALLGISTPYLKNAKINPSVIKDTQGFFGIEVEVENIRTIEGLDMNFWSHKDDGSLRNRGIEFVSKPVRGYNLIYAIESMDNYLRTTAKDHDFSDRCGIHIHMNCRKMSPEQLYALLKIYLIFERSLYKVVGLEREENPFCVPILDSMLEEVLILAECVAPNWNRYLDTIVQGWKKYTGMNLLPLSSLGTIEFRSMPGNFDKRTIYNWINIISSLKKATYRYSAEVIRERIENLNSDSKYILFARMIFDNLLDDLGPQVLNTLSEDMEEGITLNKEIITLSSEDHFHNDKKEFEQSSLVKRMTDSGDMVLPVVAKSAAEAKLNRSNLSSEIPDIGRRVQFDVLGEIARGG